MVIRITQATSSAYLHPIIKFFSSLLLAFNYFLLFIHELLPPNNELSRLSNKQHPRPLRRYAISLIIGDGFTEIRNDPLNIDRDSLVDRLARIRGGGRGVGGNGGGGCVRRRYD